MDSEKSNIGYRIGAILGTVVCAVVAATFLGLVARATWEGFSWGWSLFGL
jgi:hypothetical protein